ncbi:AAA family ATPase [Aeromonas hydrophila]|uniref:AAA family ATPase n=1 Tax=Aeromonas hydrophila TaxID=644 RepID=UPI00207D3ED9|nr:AAA family ATPase [Aeromonas hydrophila]
MALDLLAAFQQEPPALDFISSGFLTGTVGALIAPGATGKNFWALQAAMAVTCKESDGDLLQLRRTRSGLAIYMADEDPAAVLSHRVHALGKHLTAQNERPRLPQISHWNR